MKITLESAPIGDPTWREWVAANDLADCIELTQTSDTLTDWSGVFAKRRRGKYYLGRSGDVATKTKTIKTTPADPAWLTQ